MRSALNANVAKVPQPISLYSVGTKERVQFCPTSSSPPAPDRTARFRLHREPPDHDGPKPRRQAGRCTSFNNILWLHPETGAPKGRHHTETIPAQRLFNWLSCWQARRVFGQGISHGFWTFIAELSLFGIPSESPFFLGREYGKCCISQRKIRGADLTHQIPELRGLRGKS